MLHYVTILINIVFGYVRKYYYHFIIVFVKKIRVSKCVEKGVVVSLTSYGRRLKYCAPYAIISILRQTVRPEIIILNIDGTKWNKDNLPAEVEFLENKYKVYINYCDDIRSYTKLLPALQLFPDSDIITVDDDIFYSKNLLSILLAAHKKKSTAVCTIKCQIPTVSSDGTISDFNVWKQDRFFCNEKHVCALGYGGVLYPAKTFSDEVFNKKVFQSLCPTADDIWFYIRELCDEKTVYLADDHEKIILYPLNVVYEKMHVGDALAHSNVLNDANNTQFRNLLNYYNLNGNLFL